MPVMAMTEKKLASSIKKLIFWFRRLILELKTVGFNSVNWPLHKLVGFRKPTILINNLISKLDKSLKHMTNEE